MEKASSKQENTKEFHVVIKGVSLPADAVRRINRAVQKAVLAEVAALDLGGVGATFIGNGGGTQGIELIARARGTVQ
jgi:hypothetical protein